jgi:quinol-cytochrome oxidoreductase complex cytochrome b subunit
MPSLKRNTFLSFVNSLVVDHPTPVNISYLWNFGSLAGVALVIQLITGIFLAMHYVPHIDYAFISVEHIMRDVNYGWFMRYIHSNGASLFFIVVYAHMFRALYYGSYARLNKQTWILGVTIYIAMMATAFLGYVLPWGQMSLWGATVITNFFSVLAFIGVDVVSWLWGGYSVNYATLNRFYSLHFFLPFVICALVLMHLIALHEAVHSNPLGVYASSGHSVDAVENISFYPYFIVKDLFGILCFILCLLCLVIFSPNLLGHPDNYILANPLSTPPHIVPEWYFLPFYAILRSIPSKALGVILMFLSFITFYFMPFLNSFMVSSAAFRPLYRRVFWFFSVICLLLGWIGGNAVEYPYYEIGQLATFFYFFYFYFFLPYFNFLEKQLTLKI